MIIYTPLKVIYITLMLLCLTSINALTNNTSLNSTIKSGAKLNDNTFKVPIEGGGKVLSFPNNATVIPGPNLDVILDTKMHDNATLVPKDTATYHGSNDISKGGGQPLHNKTVLNTLTREKLIINQTSPDVVMEGGGKLTLSKSNVTNKTAEQRTVILSTQSVPSTSVTFHRIIPVTEPTENTRQKIAPRKGVNNSEYAEFKKKANTTVKPLIKKPLLTEASDAPSEKILSDLNLKVNVTAHGSTVPSLDRFKEFSNNTQQYVVPIVIVILSVPLVTIVLSFLLKRGAEWWKYRHYRRMDFLINGIYDT